MDSVKRQKERLPSNPLEICIPFSFDDACMYCILQTEPINILCAFVYVCVCVCKHRFFSGIVRKENRKFNELTNIWFVENTFLIPSPLSLSTFCLSIYCLEAGRFSFHIFNHQVSFWNLHANKCIFAIQTAYTWPKLYYLDSWAFTKLHLHRGWDWIYTQHCNIFGVFILKSLTTYPSLFLVHSRNFHVYRNLCHCWYIPLFDLRACVRACIFFIKPKILLKHYKCNGNIPKLQSL